jgi:hypothetical protein
MYCTDNFGSQRGWGFARFRGPLGKIAKHLQYSTVQYSNVNRRKYVKCLNVSKNKRFLLKVFTYQVQYIL